MACRKTCVGYLNDVRKMMIVYCENITVFIVIITMLPLNSTI